MELIDECRRAHPGLVWERVSDSVVRAALPAAILTVDKGSAVAVSVMSIGLVAAQATAPTVAGAIEEIYYAVKAAGRGIAFWPEIVDALRPHLNLRVEIGEDGRAALPDGPAWMDAMRGAAESTDDDVIVEADAYSVLVYSRGGGHASGDVGVVLACIADAMLAERGGA